MTETDNSIRGIDLSHLTEEERAAVRSIAKDLVFTDKKDEQTMAEAFPLKEYMKAFRFFTKSKIATTDAAE